MLKPIFIDIAPFILYFSSLDMTIITWLIIFHKPCILHWGYKELNMLAKFDNSKIDANNEKVGKRIKN